MIEEVYFFSTDDIDIHDFDAIAAIGGEEHYCELTMEQLLAAADAAVHVVTHSLEETQRRQYPYRIVLKKGRD